jgi:hypothetical protein
LVVAIVLVAGVAHADRPTAPYGRYSLDVLDPPYGYVTINGRRLPWCGDRTKPVIDNLHSFEVVYTRGKDGDVVVVDGEHWQFSGFTTPGPDYLATADSPRSAGVEVSLWFGVKRELIRTWAVGSYHVILWDSGNAVCGDARKLGGKYTPPP